MVGVLSGEQVATAAAQDVSHGAISQKALIRLQLDLKRTLWKRSFRKNIGKLVGTVIGGLYAAGGMAGLVVLLLGATLWAGDGGAFPLIARGLGGALVLGWFLIPVLAFGIDDTLDPRAFALFPRSAKELQPGMLAAAALSLPSLFTLVGVLILTAFELLWLILFGEGALWVVLAALALVPANLAAFGLCLLLPRAWFAHSASRASSRSRRELGGILAFVVMFAAIYAFSLGAQKLGEIDYQLLAGWAPTIVEALAWTPFGALFAVPMDLAEGHVLQALARAVIGTATIVLVWLWWRRSLDASLTSALTGEASSGDAKVSELVPRFVRPGPFGAVMGRALRYWRRDTRYLAALGIYPVMMVFFAGMGLVIPESRPMMLGMTLFMCGLSGISLSNEIGFDGPAGWVNIVGGLPARANLLGRVAAMAVLMVPGIVAVSVAIPLLFGMGELVLMTVMAALGMVVCSWGASMAVSVWLPYPSSPPGTNPMKDKSASSANAMIAMAVAMAALLVPMLPAIGVGVWGAVTGSLPLILLAGALALVLGAVVFLVGLRIGTARLDSRYPDVFQKVRDFL